MLCAQFKYPPTSWTMRWWLMIDDCGGVNKGVDFAWETERDPSSAAVGPRRLFIFRLGGLQGVAWLEGVPTCRLPLVGQSCSAWRGAVRPLVQPTHHHSSGQPMPSDLPNCPACDSLPPEEIHWLPIRLDCAISFSIHPVRGSSCCVSREAPDRHGCECGMLPHGLPWRHLDRWSGSIWATAGPTGSRH